MSDNVPRRDALKVIAAAPLAAPLLWEPAIARAHQQRLVALAAKTAHEPRFFTAREWPTVRLLSDLIIPADERSGSATAVGVPEFIDFMMIDQPRRQNAIRNGLAWLDAESQRRFGRRFMECGSAEHGALLDDIAWPNRAAEPLKEGVAFFVAFRNLVLTGFWTSKAGIEDLQYQGNTFVPQWDGCPPPALAKLGVSYDE